MHKKIILFFFMLALAGPASAQLQNGEKCNTLSCAKTEDPWFKARYNPDIPIFLTEENSTDTLKNLLTHEARIKTKDLIRTLTAEAFNTPYFKNNRNFASCAVVGKSGNLLGSYYGRTIDEHEFVFRMGSPPLTGHETDVGRRTSFNIIYFLQDAAVSNRRYQADTITIAYFAKSHKGKDFLSNLNSQKNYEKEFARALDLTTAPLPSPVNFKHPPTPLLFIHPKFIDYIFFNWFTPPDDNSCETGYPSTGFNTILLALHLCDKVSLFGFGANAQGVWDYYYDLQRSTKPSYNNSSYQETFIKKLISHGVITFFEGNKNRD